MLPQLDFTTFASQWFWLAVTFIAFYFVMARVALPRIAAVLDERHSRLTNDLAEAERLQKETEAVIAAYEKALAAARAQAQGLAEETRARIAAEQASRRAELDAELAKTVKSAEERIEAARDQALRDVSGIAADLAKSLAERVADISVSDDQLQSAVAAAKSARAA